MAYGFTSGGCRIIMKKYQTGLTVSKHDSNSNKSKQLQLLKYFHVHMILSGYMGLTYTSYWVCFPIMYVSSLMTLNFWMKIKEKTCLTVG